MVLGLLAATLVMVSGAGAGTTTNKLDLSTPTAINAYLQSKGIDPSTVVTQTGVNNYAGPSCPGLGWSCTTSTRVVQVAAPNGQNVDQCQGGAFTSDGCVVMQLTGERNTAKCSEHTGTTQYCLIVQQGSVRNFARVDQLISESGAGTLEGTQVADVTQGPASQKNELQLDQDIQQSTNVGDPQTENAHNYALVDQSASANGDNFAHVHQSQNQDETGGAGAQNQNTGPVPVTGVTGIDDAIAACNSGAASASNFRVTTPNACAKFAQTADSGDNEAHLHQLVNENEKTSANATQLQGGATNGLGGSFELTSDGGQSHNHTTQHEQQVATTNGGSQTQVDPVGCCGASVTGPGFENIDQFTTQQAKGGVADQTAALVGTADATGGSCSVGHHARQNQASANEQFSDNTPPCTLDIETDCASTTGGEESGGSCSTCPPDCPDVVPEITVLPALPVTLGATLAPLDVTTEPASYTLPSWYESF
jgi:hypothetical protein